MGAETTQLATFQPDESGSGNFGGENGKPPTNERPSPSERRSKNSTTDQTLRIDLPVATVEILTYHPVDIKSLTPKQFKIWEGWLRPQAA